MSNTGLSTTETWMQQYDPKEFGVNIPTTGTPRLHVCQDKSPEVKKTKIAAVGDLVVRPTGINLGKEFKGVVLSADRRFFRWASEKNGDPKDDWNRVYWQGTANELTAAQIQDTVWRGPGDNRQPPKATDTIRFIVLPVEGEGDKMVLDPKGTGAIIVTMDRTSLKAGDTLAAQLKAIKAPSFVSVINFTTFSDATKKDVQVWAPKHVGYVPQKHGKTLADAARVANGLWASMGGGGHGDEETTAPPTTGASAKPAVDDEIPF